MRQFIVVVALLGSSLALATPVQSAATYLQAEQNFDGSFGRATSTDPILTTSVAVQALTAVLGSNSTSVQAARAFLSGSRPSEIDLEARRLQALDGTPLSDTLTAAIFRSAAQSSSGFGFLETDSAPTLLESAQAIAFLAGDSLLTATASPPPINFQPAAGCSQTSVICAQISPLLQFILAAQNKLDGGWAFSGESSDVRLTAEIASVLMPLRKQLNIDTQLTSAVNFLLAQQGADGHFGSATPSTADTAMAMIALVGAPTTQSTAVNKAVTFLTGTQKPDGSWDESELDTALVARGLEAILPTLGVTQSVAGTDGSLALSTDSPPADGTVTATVTIVNTGDSASTGTTVVFTAVGVDGQPSVVLGSANVGVLNAGASGNVSDTLNTSGLVGPYEIIASIQPPSNGSQSSPVGSAQSQVGAQADITSTYDLALTPTDIAFGILDAGGVLDAGVATLTATIHEDGTAISTPFNVAFYEGNPTAGGTLIGESSVSSIAAGGTATASQNWVVSLGNGLTPIYVVADPEGAIADNNRANNIAWLAYQAPSKSTDLAVFTAGITFNPVQPAPSTPLQVTATVLNQSAVDAFNVQVAFCPSALTVQSTTPACPTSIVTLPVVPANSSTPVSFPVPINLMQLPPLLSFGTLQVVVTVDPFNQLTDSNRNNNSASANVYFSDHAGFEITGFTAQNPPYTTVAAGTSAQLQGTVKILSSRVLHIPYTLYVGAPEQGGVAQVSGVIEASPQGSVLNVTGTTVGPATLFVLVLDPENTLHNTVPGLARASYAYVANSATDLGIKFNDISFTPSGPSIGDTTTVAVNVHNYGDAGATSELWAFEGNPAILGSSVIGQFPVSVAGGQTQQVSFSWTRQGGATLFFQLMETFPLDLNSNDDFALRNAYLEGVYSSGRVDAYGYAPFTSAPVVGDLLGTGSPVIAYGESANLSNSYQGHLTLVQKSSTNTLTTLWTKQVDDGVGTPVFVNVGGDGGPSIVFLSVTGPLPNPPYANRGNTLHVWNPQGTAIWEKSYVNGSDGGPTDACMNETNFNAPGVGDVNGDGYADVVFLTSDRTLHVLDGRNGNAIWESTLPTGVSCVTNLSYSLQPAVLDINGDGKNEVIVGVGSPTSNYGNTLIYSSTGTLLSSSAGVFFSGTNKTHGNFIVASPTGPGGLPAILTTSTSDQVQAVVDGGVQLWQTAVQDQIDYPQTLVASDSRGDGRPLFFTGTQTGATGLDSQGNPIWSSAEADIGAFSATSALDLAAADLLGQGQPQILVPDALNGLNLIDGRTGQTLLQAGVTLADWAAHDEAGEQFGLAVADVDNDGHGEVVLTNFGDSTDSLPSYTLWTTRTTGYDQQASLLIFGSDKHWQPMPNVWSGIGYHHQFNADLTLSADAYHPWTTHNTWREQFVTSPTTLMADLVIANTDGGETDISWAPSPSDGGSVPAGNTSNVTVTVHNIGGVAATSVPVSLYLGNPADGGVFLATQTISGTLDAGGGIGSTVFAWTAWPEGWDQLTAIANAPFSDGGRAITESNYQNNQYATTAFVLPGTQLADLSVAGANFGTTLGYAAGQPVTLQTTVTNNGSVNAGAFSVVFIDGAGDVGPVIGTTHVSGLKAGASTVVEITNWLPAQGVHVVTVQADPAELIPDSNLSNNTAVITFTIGNATKPDLQITSTDLTLTPSGPVEPGTTLELGCTLHNEGTSTSNVLVKVTLDPGANQTVLLSSTISATLPTGIALPFTVPVPTTGLAAGLHTLTVAADPNNTISEYNETNNSASISFVVGTAPASVIVSTDKSSYGASAVATVTASLDGLTTAAAASLILNVEIETAAGDPVASLANGLDLSLGSGVTENLTYTWNTGSTASGNYLAFAWLTDVTTGITVSTSQAAFTITATVIDAVTVAPLLNGYQPDSTAVVETQIADQSLNASIANATLVLQINTPGAQSFYTSTREFLNIGTGKDLKLLDSVPISFSSAAGNYPITATLKTQSGTTLATGTGTLVVQTATVANEFTASLTATPAAVAPGAAVALAATLTNQTGVALANESLVVEVVVPATQVVIANFPVNQNFAIGQQVNLNDQWNTAGVAVGQYLAVLTVNTVAVAHAVIQVDAAGGVPPLIVVSGVSDGELTNQTVTPVITLTTPSGNIASSTITLNGAAFASGTPVAAAGNYVLAISVTDNKGNSASVNVSFTIYQTAPRITIGGVSNNQYTNAAAVAPTVAIADPYLDPTKTVMTLNGTTFYQGMQITAEGSYTLSVSAQDKAGNSALATVVFVIDRTRPVITITGVTNGEYTNAASVTATITVTDLNLNNTATSITLNAAAYVSGTAITAEGNYSLIVSAADLAGNTASQTVNFYIDRTAPVITVNGVANGATYAGAVQATFTIIEAHPKTSGATLDGAAYTANTAITSGGSHTLVVTATDQAGNTSSVTDTFTISAPSAPPFFNPGICASSVTLSNGAFVAPLTDAGVPILLNSSGPFSAANTSLVIGSAIAAGNLTFSDTSDLTGTVLLGGTETLNGQAIVNAVVQEAAGYTSPCCAFNVTTALTSASTNNDNARLPTAISSLVIDGGFAITSGSVSFPSGDFYFLSFEVGDGGAVGIASGAVTQLYVNGPFSVQGTFGGDSTRLGSLTVLASGNISLSAGQAGNSQGGVTIFGEYPVPGLFYSGSTVSLSGSTELIGGVVANTLNVSGSASVLVPLSLTPPDAGMVCQ